MRQMTFVTLVLLIVPQSPASVADMRPVHTYSIVAQDSVTGELGVAVQSHWFSVGSVVSWAEAGIGAVATQSFVEVSYGPLGLELMRAGKTAREALDALLSIDPNAAVRQVAMIDRFGNVAVHTGERCIAMAGHVEGKGFTTQANMMEQASVWDAMATAYRSAKGDLLERLVTALEAAEQEGGDIRGKQSAAILIVPGKSQGAPWRERLVDLRVDDSSEPLKELRRLVRIHRAYTHMNKGDELLANNDTPGALEQYRLAGELYPQNLEIKYWVGVTLASAGQVNSALPIFAEIFKKEPRWLELTKRLPQSGLLPNDKALLEKIFHAAKTH